MDVEDEWEMPNIVGVSRASIMGRNGDKKIVWAVLCGLDVRGEVEVQERRRVRVRDRCALDARLRSQSGNIWSHTPTTNRSVVSGFIL